MRRHKRLEVLHRLTFWIVRLFQFGQAIGQRSGKDSFGSSKSGHAVSEEDIPCVETTVSLRQARPDLIHFLAWNEAKAAGPITAQKRVDHLPPEPVWVIAAHHASVLARAGRRIDEVSACLGLCLQVLLHLRTEVTYHRMSPV